MTHNYTPEDDRPHVASHVCGKCRKEFERGHRIGMAYIFDRKGLNPTNFSSQGAYLHEEFELVHIDCTDPFLVRGIR